MKVWLKAMLPKPVLQYIRQIRERWFDIYAKRSYSQEGEDMLLDRFLEDRSVGSTSTLGPTIQSDSPTPIVCIAEVGED